MPRFAADRLRVAADGHASAPGLRAVRLPALQHEPRRKSVIGGGKKERATGVEPATSSLGSWFDEHVSASFSTTRQASYFVHPADAVRAGGE
jgi:hypothetical protein